MQTEWFQVTLTIMDIIPIGTRFNEIGTLRPKKPSMLLLQFKKILLILYYYGC